MKFGKKINTEDDGFWRVDAWRPSCEEGEVIAYIDDLTGRVLYHSPEARIDSAAQKLIREKCAEIPENMTNRKFLVRILADPNWIDDGGACYDSWLHYNIGCPYFSGDKRAHCHGKPDGFINWDNCNLCKDTWLDQEVDS